MKKIHLQIIAGTIIIGVIGILGLDYYQNNFPKKSISEYYAILDNQENIFADEKITKEQIRDLEFCEDDFKCFAKYYENYNASSTLAKTFSNVALLLKENPKYADYCHFIMHGIGYSELAKNNGDIGKTLNIFSVGQMYKNFSTCGNGYIHGVLEEGVKNIKDKEKLVDFFNKMCETEEMKKAGVSDCYHGLGHASFLQLDLNAKDAVYVCKNVAKSVYEEFNCYTGVFMEAGISLSQNQIIQKVGEGKKQSFVFPICDNVENELERQACFFEGAIQFRNFVKKDIDQKVHFADMTPMCKIFNDDYYRLICIRNISIRAITDNRETDLEKMCIENTSSRAERIMCVLGFAHRLALSIDENKGVKYMEIYKDVCRVLKQDEAIVCEKIIKETPLKAYYFTAKDIDSLNF